MILTRHIIIKHIMDEEKRKVTLNEAFLEALSLSEGEASDIEDLSIIKFTYSGSVQLHNPKMKNYREEKWVLIKEDIEIDKIIEVVSSMDFVRLKHNS